ncbi:MAG: hypothetical protein H6713_28165 [Myxococcales bacterium]|nr:hypothetical protein [Myxococcales bacterium]
MIRGDRVIEGRVEFTIRFPRFTAWSGVIAAERSRVLEHAAVHQAAIGALRSRNDEFISALVTLVAPLAGLTPVDPRLIDAPLPLIHLGGFSHERRL